jgi:hypothetical protein
MNERDSSEIREAGHDELVRFGRALVAGGIVMDSAEAVLDYFEEPWKWTVEYRFWDRLGRPTDELDAAWDGFCEIALRGESAMRLWMAETDA